MDELMIAAIDGGDADQIFKIVIPIFIGVFLVLITLHFIYGWLLSRIAKKNHYPSPWLSYVPIAQFSVFLSLGGQSGKHVFWMFLPFVGVFVFFYFIILAAINLCKNNGESKLFTFVLASPFVGLWGLYRLGNPGGGVPLSKTHQALIQTAQSLIQQGRTSEEIMAMMIQAGVNGDEVRTIYNQAKSGTPLVNSQSGASNRKPLSGKMIGALFILGFVLNTILSTIFGLVFGNLFIPSELKDLENMVTEEFNNEAFWGLEEMERETQEDSSTQTTNAEAVSPDSSLDSEACIDTDNGQDEYTKGSTTGVWDFYTDNSTQTSTHTDGCRFNNGEINGLPAAVGEYYCNSLGKKSEILIDCEYGCEDGACLKNPSEEFSPDQTPEETLEPTQPESGTIPRPSGPKPSPSPVPRN